MPGLCALAGVRAELRFFGSRGVHIDNSDGGSDHKADDQSFLFIVASEGERDLSNRRSLQPILSLRSEGDSSNRLWTTHFLAANSVIISRVTEDQNFFLVDKLAKKHGHY
jgi:hypothetical protein